MKTTCDMTQGNPLKLLLQFTLPMLAGNLFQQFYNIVDSIIVGNYVGADALAAVGASGSVNFLFFSLCIGMASGVGIVISQYFGAKEERSVRIAIMNSTYLMIFSALLMATLGFFLATPLFKLLDTPANIIEYTVTYFRTSCIGLLAVALYNGVSSILRALGDSKTPLYFLIVASFVNIILDLLFIRVFHLGVFGAALATIISQIVSAVGCIIWALWKNPYFTISSEYCKFHWPIIKRCACLGFPVALQNAMIAVSCVALQRVVNSFGTQVVAAFTVTNRIEQLVQQPFNSLGAAVSTFSGQNIGAGNINRVKDGYKKSFFIMAIFSFTMLFVAQFLGEPIVKVFLDNSETKVIALGTQALKITSCFYFFLGMIYITRALLNGTGDTIYSFINGIIEMIGRIGLAKPLTLIPSLGVYGVWAATALTWFITGIVSLIRYSSGKWKTKGIIHKSN